MSQTVQFKNAGFTDPIVLNKALAHFGWEMVASSHQANSYRGICPKHKDEYRTSLWYTHTAGAEIILNYDGDYRSTMEGILGQDFDGLRQQYKVELCNDVCQEMGGQVEYTTLTDGTLEVRIFA